MSLTDLEKKVLEHLLDGDHPVLKVLRKQFEVCGVQERKMTGVGFFTTMTVPQKAPTLGESVTCAFGDVHAELDGREEPVGFVLFVKKGMLHKLEGYSYGLPWPHKILGFRLTYDEGNERDLGNLLRTIDDHTSKSGINRSVKRETI